MIDIEVLFQTWSEPFLSVCKSRDLGGKTLEETQQDAKEELQKALQLIPENADMQQCFDNFKKWTNYRSSSFSYYQQCCLSWQIVILSGNLAWVNNLLKNMHVEETESNQRTLSRLAVCSGNVDILWAIENKYPNLAALHSSSNISSIVDETIATAATEYGQTATLIVILDKYPHYRKHMSSSIGNIAHTAAYCNQLETLLALINKYPKLIVKRNSSGYTIAHFLAEQGHTESLLTILAGCPDLINIQDEKGNTIADKAAGTKGDCPQHLFAILEKFPHLKNLKNKMGWTIAHHAADNGNTKTLAEILKIYPDLKDIRTIQGDTLLHIALPSKYTMHFLLDINPLSVIQTKNKKGKGVLTKLAEVIFNDDEPISILTSIFDIIINRKGTSISIEFLQEQLPIIKEIFIKPYEQIAIDNAISSDSESNSPGEWDYREAIPQKIHDCLEVYRLFQENNFEATKQFLISHSDLPLNFSLKGQSLYHIIATHFVTDPELMIEILELLNTKHQADPYSMNAQGKYAYELLTPTLFGLGIPREFFSEESHWHLYHFLDAKVQQLLKNVLVDGCVLTQKVMAHYKSESQVHSIELTPSHQVELLMYEIKFLLDFVTQFNEPIPIGLLQPLNHLLPSKRPPARISLLPLRLSETDEANVQCIILNFQRLNSLMYVEKSLRNPAVTAVVPLNTSIKIDTYFYDQFIKPSQLQNNPHRKRNFSEITQDNNQHSFFEVPQQQDIKRSNGNDEQTQTQLTIANVEPG